MLYTYLQQVQRLLGYDETQAMYSLDDLTVFVNMARQEVAAQGQCIRRTSPVSGSILELQIANTGSGYTAPVVTVSAPDQPSGILPYPLGAQATAVAQQIGGQLSNISVGFGGAGYFSPVVSVSDPTGSGATITPIVTPLNATTIGQEVYEFRNVPMSFPGVGPILSLRGITMLWNSSQWTCGRVSFSKYNALIRQYSSSFLAPPVWACQFGQGVDGSVHLYPLPDQPYQMIWDCSCLPFDLDDDDAVEAIPAPWTTAVPFYAAHLALLGRCAEIPQLMPLCFRYFNEKDGGLFGLHMRRARAFSQPGAISSFYGRV